MPRANRYFATKDSPTTYYTGDAETDLARAGWYSKNSKDTPHPVGQKTSNAWGVYDMHGNAWEWCADGFEEYKGESVVDPYGPAEGRYRVLRGGFWDSSPRFCRSAVRLRNFPDIRYFGLGFRVVVAAPRTPLFSPLQSESKALVCVLRVLSLHLRNELLGVADWPVVLNPLPCDFIKRKQNSSIPRQTADRYLRPPVRPRL